VIGAPTAGVWGHRGAPARLELWDASRWSQPLRKSIRHRHVRASALLNDRPYWLESKLSTEMRIDFTQFRSSSPDFATHCHVMGNGRLNSFKSVLTKAVVCDGGARGVKEAILLWGQEPVGWV